MLNTTTQPQNTTILNISNLTSQLMEMITEATLGRSNLQNNTTSNVNTEGEYFSHFGIIRANPFEGFEAFGRNNNNNNNPPSGNNNNNNLPSLQKPYKSQQYRIDIESISSRCRIHIEMILTSNLHRNEIVTIRIRHWYRHRINVIIIS